MCVSNWLYGIEKHQALPNSLKQTLDIHTLANCLWCECLKVNHILLASHLKNGEVFQDAVHHVFFWEVLESVDEAHHVVAHGRAIDPIHKPSLVKPGILRLEGETDRDTSVSDNLYHTPTPATSPPSTILSALTASGIRLSTLSHHPEVLKPFSILRCPSIT